MEHCFFQLTLQVLKEIIMHMTLCIIIYVMYIYNIRIIPVCKQVCIKGKQTPRKENC